MVPRGLRAVATGELAPYYAASALEWCMLFSWLMLVPVYASRAPSMSRDPAGPESPRKSPVL